VLGNKVMVAFRRRRLGHAYNLHGHGLPSRHGAWRRQAQQLHMVGSHHMLFEAIWAFNMTAIRRTATRSTTRFSASHDGLPREVRDYLAGVAVDDLHQQATTGPVRTRRACLFLLETIFVATSSREHKMDGFIYGDEVSSQWRLAAQIYDGWLISPTRFTTRK